MTSLAVSNDGGNIKVVMGAAIGEAGTAHATYTLVSTNMITGEQTTRVFTEDISVPGSGSTVTGSISNRNMSDMYTYELTAELNFTASDGTDYLWTGTWANG